jgi:hypothetical protein
VLALISILSLPKNEHLLKEVSRLSRGFKNLPLHLCYILALLSQYFKTQEIDTYALTSLIPFLIILKTITLLRPIRTTLPDLLSHK